jgi:hypothetical protein
MTPTMQSGLAVLGFLAAAGILALGVGPGQTNEIASRGICSNVTWPETPARCLRGAGDRTVRLVGADLWMSEAGRAEALRIQVSSEGGGQG